MLQMPPRPRNGRWKQRTGAAGAKEGGNARQRFCTAKKPMLDEPRLGQGCSPAPAEAFALSLVPAFRAFDREETRA